MRFMTAAVMVTAFAMTASAQKGDASSQPELKWGPAPAVFPPGAQMAVLQGDPSGTGLFTVRLRMPNGYKIAPHTHPAYEVDTVISGTIKLGMGETADRSAAKAVPAGSFFAMPPGTAHFAYFDEETVLQLTTNGPWSIKYINPADDPRNQ